MASSDVKGLSEVCRECQHTTGAAVEVCEKTIGQSAGQKDREEAEKFLGRCVAHHHKLLE
jgi:hypothetical protein